MAYLDQMLTKAKEAPNVPTGPKNAPEGQKVLIDSYDAVKIYRDSREAVPLYEIEAPHFRGEEKNLIEALMEIALNVITVEASALTVEEKRQKYFQRIIEIIEQTPELKVPVNAKEFYAKAVVQEMVGYGIIDVLTQDDQLEEIMIIGSNKPVYVYHRKYDMVKTNIMYYADSDIRNLADRIARAVNRRIDLQTPLLDARLPDGTRVNATIPPISLDGTTITLRKFKKDPLSVVDLANYGTLSYEAAAFLWMASDGIGAYPANALVAGGTASGKTTALNMLTGFVPNNERVITIEDTAELNLPLQHWIRMEVRPPSIEGTGEVSMDDLVKNSLRMRPDRIIVGEVRGAEGHTMFAAMNTGHRGVMGTVHANSAKETLVRLTSPPIDVPLSMISSLNLIIMINRIHDRRKGAIRRVTEIAEVVPSDELKMPTLQTLYQWDPIADVMRATGLPSFYLQLLSKYTGLSTDDLNQEIIKRTKILEQLGKEGKRNINDVCNVTQNYLASRRLKV
ncbi:CpaF family protein [Candidatus Micrarchaeota archaeon]|nr:CpaF family protein [Candidatus Micrarchaeota archaeon]